MANIVRRRRIKGRGWHGDRPGHVDAGKKSSLTKLKRVRHPISQEKKEAQNEYRRLKNQIDENKSYPELAKIEKKLNTLHKKGYIGERAYDNTKYELNEIQYQAAGNYVDSKLITQERDALVDYFKHSPKKMEEIEPLTRKVQMRSDEYQKNPTPANKRKFEETIKELKKANRR